MCTSKGSVCVVVSAMNHQTFEDLRLKPHSFQFLVAPLVGRGSALFPIDLRLGVHPGASTTSRQEFTACKPRSLAHVEELVSLAHLWKRIGPARRVKYMAHMNVKRHASVVHIRKQMGLSYIPRAHPRKRTLRMCLRTWSMDISTPCAVIIATRSKLRCVMQLLPILRTFMPEFVIPRMPPTCATRRPVPSSFIAVTWLPTTFLRSTIFV